MLTAAAALEVLGPDYRFTTTVQVGSSPNTIVLIGGGDPTLARYGDNVYPGSASLLDLAGQVNSKWASLHPGEDIEHIVLDASMWDRNDKWDDSWDRIEQELGYSSEVTALMVDGDRDDPYSATSPRSTDPITRAGEAFADALGVPGATLSSGTSIAGQQLGQVQSPTIAELIPYMLMVSDNTLADQLAGDLGGVRIRRRVGIHQQRVPRGPEAVRHPDRRHDLPRRFRAQRSQRRDHDLHRAIHAEGAHGRGISRPSTTACPPPARAALSRGASRVPTRSRPAR